MSNNTDRGEATPTLIERVVILAIIADRHRYDLDYEDRWNQHLLLKSGAESRLSAGEAAVAEAARLRKALQEAIALAEEGWGYAGDYFREKWGYEQQMAALKTALEEKE